MTDNQAFTRTISFQQYFYIVAITLTVILGVIWQGGELFWFGPAAASATSLLFLFGIKNYRCKTYLPTSTITIFLYLFIAWCFVTSLWSVVPTISLIRAFTILSSLIGLYSYFFLTNAHLSWERVWYAIILAGLILFIYTCIELYIGIQFPNSLFFNKNTHAAYLNLIIIPTSAFFLLSNNRHQKLFLGIALFALVFSHGLPGSRGATFGQFIGIGFILFAGYKSLSRRVLAQFFSIYISALSIATLFTSHLFRFFEYDLANVDLGRKEIWSGAFNLLSETPWYGSGVGTYWLTHPAYRHINDPSSGQNPHNDYLQYLIETGAPGLILLLLLMASVIYYWFRFIKNPNINSSSKIEASGLVGALAAISFHSFFTFNLGLFSVLFLIGIILGRFIHLLKHTKEVSLFHNIPLKKNIFNLLYACIFTMLLLYFSTISVFSHLYISAADAFSEGDVSKADKLNSIALTIFPYDDRPYLLYVRIYISILNKISELDSKERQFFFDKSESYIKLAKEINPLINRSDHLHAQLIEQNPELAGENWENKVIKLYLNSLKKNPLYIYSARRLAQFYTKMSLHQQAADIIYHSIKYYRPPSKELLAFYNYSEQFITKSNNPLHSATLQHKKAELMEYLRKKIKR